MIKKAVFVVFDGLCDRPLKEFGGKTPLEHAKTPNLDAIAKRSQCGLMHPLGFGKKPGSDVSHLNILGYPYDQYYTGRGPIEVAGLGIKLQDGDVAFRGNFGSVDGNWNILDRRCGRIKDVTEFAAAIDGLEIDDIKLIVKPGTAYRAGVVLRGKGLSAAISDCDPHEEGKPVMTVKPTDNTKQAAFTAAVLNKFLRKTNEILNAMATNKQRVKDGLVPANFLLVRGAGVVPTMQPFHEKFGMRAACIAGGGLYKGIGSFLGMDVLSVPGATGMPDTDVAAKCNAVVKSLESYDFVFCHIKASDSLGEDGNHVGKKEFIEKADKAMAILAKLPDDVLLVITADHTTPCELKTHSADPVTILFCNPSCRIDDVQEIGERAFAKGGLGRIDGKDVMTQIMNLMGKLHLVGA